MVTIKNVKVSDAEELLKIYAPYVLNTSVSFETKVPTKREFKRRIRETKKSFPYLKAEKDGKIVGYAYANPFKKRDAYRFCAEVSIYVIKEYTRQGIGKMLYEELEKRLKEKGIVILYAVITADEDKDGNLKSDSIDFHSAMGYVKCGEFRNCGFKFGTWHSMVYYQKKLSQ